MPALGDAQFPYRIAARGFFELRNMERDEASARQKPAAAARWLKAPQRSGSAWRGPTLAPSEPLGWKASLYHFRAEGAKAVANVCCVSLTNGGRTRLRGAFVA